MSDNLFPRPAWETTSNNIITYQGITDWLRLADVSKIATTLLGPLSGYFIVSNSISLDFIYFLLIVPILHTGIFILNDVSDYEIDNSSDRNEKPLVSKEIDLNKAQIFGYTFLIFGCAAAFIAFHPLANVILWSGIGLGWLYNRVSSTTPFGVVILGCWGVVSVLFGAFVGGSPSIDILPIAFLFGIVLLHITYVSDITDIKSDPYSLPIYLGVERNGNIINFSLASIIFEIFINISKIVLIAMIIYIGGTFSIFTIVGLVIHFYYNKCIRKKLNVNRVANHAVNFYRSGVMVLVLSLLAYVHMALVAILFVLIFTWSIGVGSFLQRSNNVRTGM